MTSSVSEGFSQLVTDRQSVRAYLPNLVPDSLLRQVLTAARQAPSGANLQPGAFWSIEGAARARLSAQLIDALRSGQQEAE